MKHTLKNHGSLTRAETELCMRDAEKQSRERKRRILEREVKL